MIRACARQAAALLLTCWTASSGDKVVGGPYVVNVTPTSATVMFLVQEGEISIGSAPSTLDRTMPLLRAERITFTGLAPNRTYYYDAFPGQEGKGSFKTPPRRAAKFQFVVYGDVRTRHDVHRSVIEAMLRETSPDFVVHTGDLVENGPDTSQWPVFFDIERELLRKTAFYPAIGNHERNARNFFEFLDSKPYYSFDWGTAHFSVIDSDRQNLGTTEAEREACWRDEVRWLESDLENAQKADFRFVVAHHPPLSAVEGRQPEIAHMTALMPMLEKYQVTAGFFGHDHNYQHYLRNGVHYFVTGGGGAPLYGVDAPPAGLVKGESTENFVIVDVDGSKARVTAKKPNGDIVDVAELGRLQGQTR